MEQVMDCNPPLRKLGKVENKLKNKPNFFIKVQMEDGEKL